MSKVLVFLFLGLSFLFGGEPLNLSRIIEEEHFKDEKFYKKMIKMFPVEFPLAAECSNRGDSCLNLKTPNEHRICRVKADAKADIACEKLIEIYEPLCNEHNNGIACTSMAQLYNIFFTPHYGKDYPTEWGDHAKEVLYLEKACKLGEKYGCQLLGYEYNPTSEYFKKNGNFTEKDAERFFNFAKKACTGFFGCQYTIDGLELIKEKKLYPISKKDMQWFSEQAILEEGQNKILEKEWSY